MRSIRTLTSVLILVLGALAAARAAEEDAPDGASADPKRPELTVTVTTFSGEQVAGKVASLSDEQLTLDGDKPQVFQLANLERIDLGAAAATVPQAAGDVVWVGQDNQDLVQVGNAPGGNGIQDVHLRISRLSHKAIKQIAVICRFPKLLRVWRLDTTASPHWRLAIARSELEPQADLYIEPPADDSYGMNFDVTVVYDDGATSKSSVAALTHTSDQLKVDRQAKPGETSQATKEAPPEVGIADVWLAGRGRLRGTIASLSQDAIVLRAPWSAELELPRLHTAGIWFGQASPAGGKERFDDRLTEPAADDVVFLAAPDKTVAEVSGKVRSLDDQTLVLQYDAEDRQIKRERLLGLVFAARAKLPPAEGTFQTFVLADGQSLSGRWTGWDEAGLLIQMPWQASLHVPVDAVNQIRVRNGNIVYLPDLEPIAVDEQGYFGRTISWRADQGFDGGAPVMQGSTPQRVLATHARCVLTYALNGQYEKFVATLGFDDSSHDRGRVACRILADDRELFAEPDLRANEEPRRIDVSVQGVQQMTLEVDFGAEADVGDRVLWVDPRLFRNSKN